MKIEKFENDEIGILNICLFTELKKLNLSIVNIQNTDAILNSPDKSLIDYVEINAYLKENTIL